MPTCEACHGSGQCSKCGGTGVDINWLAGLAGGLRGEPYPCPAECDEGDCPECDGDGYV